MTVNSTYVGTLFKPYHAMVVPRDTMNFAASIGDRNPCYFDDENEGGVAAHPMHCAAVTWPILERIHEFIGIEDFPFEILATQVHYSECLSLHRLLVPGDRLKIQGRIAAILPHRAGTHMITRLDALDETDQPVFSEHIGGLMRGVECTDKGRAEAGAPPVSPPESEPTFTWESSILIDDLMPYIYDGCTRIHFPIHTSRQFARHVGLPDIILQGTATLSLAVREIVNQEAGADPRRVKSIACRFTDIVIPGERIIVQASRVDPSGNVRFQVKKATGQPAIRHGFIKLG